MKTQNLSLALVVGLGVSFVPSTLQPAQGDPAPRVIAADEGVVGRGANGFDAQFKVGSISTGSSKLYMATGVVPPNSETPPHLA